jgi:drug/metabolite transporter (DMT)-like permease
VSSPTLSQSMTADAHAAIPLRGFAVVLGSAALFGMLGPLSRFAYDAGLEPTAFVTWRAFIGFAGLGAYVAWRVRRGALRLVRWSDLPARARTALLVAALAGTIVNLCMFIAFDRITIALALLGFYTYPAMIAVFGFASGRERIDGRRAAALGLALAGMIAVVASQVDPAAGVRFDTVGFGLALGAAVSQAIFVIIGRDGYRAVPTEQAMTTILLVSGIGALLVALVVGGPGPLVLPVIQPDVLPLLVFTGVAAAAIPSFGFLTGIRLIGGTRVGILMLFEPVVGVVLAALLLHEGLAPFQVAGAIAILGAAVLLQRTPTPSSRSDAEAAASLVVPGGP